MLAGAWSDNGSVSVLAGRKRHLGSQALPVEVAARPCAVGVVVTSEQPVSDKWMMISDRELQSDTIARRLRVQ